MKASDACLDFIQPPGERALMKRDEDCNKMQTGD